jgi:hypothetical protein
MAAAMVATGMMTTMATAAVTASIRSGRRRAGTIPL